STVVVPWFWTTKTTATTAIASPTHVPAGTARSRARKERLDPSRVCLLTLLLPCRTLPDATSGSVLCTIGGCTGQGQRGLDGAGPRRAAAHDVSDHRDRGRTHAHLARPGGDRGERGHRGALARTEAVLDHSRGAVRV